MKLIKFFIATFIVAAVAAVFFNSNAFSDENYRKDIGFCVNCHEMKPNYFTWKVTSHNQFGCIKCHQDLNPTTFVYKHWKGVVPNPIESREIIPDGVCRNCHTQKRTITPPDDIIFPHQLHVMKQIDCVDCHSNVTHLNIADHIKKNENFSSAAFNESKATQLIKKKNQIPMPVCMRCHNGQMATDKCNACHKKDK